MSTTEDMSRAARQIADAKMRATAKRLLKALPGLPEDLTEVEFASFAKLHPDHQTQLFQLIDQGMSCSIVLLAQVASQHDDAELFVRYLSRLIPEERKALTIIYRQTRIALKSDTNTAAKAINDHFRETLIDMGFMFGVLSEYRSTGASVAVISGASRYIPNRSNKEHKSLRIGDEVIFYTRGITIYNTRKGRLCYVTMTCLTEH